MKHLLAMVLVFSFSPTLLHAAALESIYTDMTPQRCKTVIAHDEEGENRTMFCPGVAGYKLTIVEGDLRTSMNVTAPGGAESPLDLWSVVSGGFSSLGSKVEWRVEKQAAKTIPRAIIVRFNASENADKPDKTTSYLVTVKLTPNQICATEKIPPGPQQNEQARIAADVSADKACLTSK